MKWLLDTNVLIEFLNGVEKARQVLESEQATAISLVSWMEVMVGAAGEDEEKYLRAWLGGFSVLGIDDSVAERAVALRRHRKKGLSNRRTFCSSSRPADRRNWVRQKETGQRLNALLGVVVKFRHGSPEETILDRRSGQKDSRSP